MPYFIAPPRANGDPADAPATIEEEEDEEDDTPLILPSEELDNDLDYGDDKEVEDQPEELEESEDEDDEAGPEVEEEEREVLVEEVSWIR